MIIPLTFAQVTHVFGGTGLPRGAAVTYGIERPPTFSAEDVASQTHIMFGVEIVPGLCTTTRLERTIVKFGPNLTGQQGEYSENISGTSAAPQSPPSVALLIRKRTALGGRANRGRMFLPGFTEESTNPDGTIQSSTVSAFQTRFDTWLAALTSYEAPMVVLHNTSSDPTTVTNLVVDSRVATQRRRLR